jgi:hypothetical protein
MSQFYRYNFISPEPLIALISEELKSYLDTGAVDNAVWSIYITKCLKKLGRGSYTIRPAVIEMCNYEGRLPDDFYAVREAWSCSVHGESWQLPNAQYQQVSTSTLLNPNDYYCEQCNDCTPDIIQAVYKTTNQVVRQWKKQHLLKPGNIWSRGECSEDCANFHSHGPDSFDISGNKLITSFREGTVYLLYYSKELDENGYPMIPDNYRIQEYIEAFIKQKVFEQLANQTVDETYNQIQNKALQYKQAADEAYVTAQVESKIETTYKKHHNIIKTLNRFDRFQLRW